MPLDPASADPDEGAPEDYARAHPTEIEAVWGWHARWGPTARAAGLLVVVVLLLMSFTRDSARGYVVVVWVVAAILLVLLLRGTRRRFARRAEPEQAPGMKQS